MILVRNVEQGEMSCCVQEWQLWLSYFWSISPSCIWIRFHVRSYNLWIIIILPGRIVVWDNMLRTRRTTLAFLLLELFPLLMFQYDLCLLCNTYTLRNILMITGRNVEQDKTVCRLQEWHFWQGWGAGVGICFLFGFFCVFFFSKKPFSSLLLFFWENETF